MPKNRAAEEAFFATRAASDESWGGHGLPRASSIGGCLTEQYFAMMAHREPELYEGVKRSGQSAWNTDEGHWLEPQVYEVLREQGYIIHNIQTAAVLYQPYGTDEVSAAIADEGTLKQLITKLKFEGHRPLMTMHIDGMIEHGPDDLHDTLLELKKITMFAFSGVVQNSVEVEKKVYLAQANVSMLAFGLKHTRFYVFSKDQSAVNWLFHVMRSANPIDENTALHVEDIDADPTVQQQAILRAKLLLDAADQAIPPMPDQGFSPFNYKITKKGEKQRVFPCWWSSGQCAYLDHCVDMHVGRGVDPAFEIIVADERTKKERERATGGEAVEAQRDVQHPHLGAGQVGEVSSGTVIPFPVPDQLRSE